MRTTVIVAALCGAWLVAGCGSSGHAPSTPSRGAKSTAGPTSHGPPIAKPGAAGRIGPSSAGNYSATGGEVLFHIRIALVRFFTSKDFSGVTARCTGINATTASCDVVGTNRSNQTGSAVLTLSVDQTNGDLRITHVTP